MPEINHPVEHVLYLTSKYGDEAARVIAVCDLGATVAAEALAATAADGTGRDLAAIVEKASGGDLGDLVHEVASRQASTVNNGGPAAQINYLVAQLGAKAALAAVKDALAGS